MRTTLFRRTWRALAVCVLALGCNSNQSLRNVNFDPTERVAASTRVRGELASDEAPNLEGEERVAGSRTQLPDSVMLRNVDPGYDDSPVPR